MKTLGHCTLCDKEVFEIIRRYPSYLPNGSDHPYANEPMKVGKPLPDAKRVSFVLLDGSRCDLTFCSTCEPGKLSDMWKLCIDATIKAALPETREIVNPPGVQYEFGTREQMICAKFLINFAYNVPFGELYTIPWGFYDA